MLIHAIENQGYSEMPEIDADRLASLPILSKGAHEPDGEMCVMEAVAYCACPVITAFLVTWNDNLPDEERETLLKSLVPRIVGTRSTKDIEMRRATMATDWLIRTHTPAWLRLAGLTEQADALVSLPEITNFAQCPSLMPTLKAVQKDSAAARVAAGAAAGVAAGAAAGVAAGAAAGAAAWAAAGAAAGAAAWAAARAAAGDAAGDAARAAAWAAAGAAAWAAARAAAWDAARAAAWDAARAAAWAAAKDVLKPTKIALQQSALELVNRMIDCGKESE